MFWFNKPTSGGGAPPKQNFDSLRRQHDRLVDQAQRSLSAQRAAYEMGDTEGGHTHGSKAHEFTNQALGIYKQLPKEHQAKIDEGMKLGGAPKRPAAMAMSTGNASLDAAKMALAQLSAADVVGSDGWDDSPHHKYGAVAQQPEHEHKHVSLLKQLTRGADHLGHAYQRGSQQADHDLSEAGDKASNPPPHEKHKWLWQAGYAITRHLGHPGETS